MSMHDGNSAASLATLPAELLLLIIKSLETDVQTLVSLALTCKGLQPLIYSCLYRKISLRPVIHFLPKTSNTVSSSLNDRKHELLHRTLVQNRFARLFIRQVDIQFTVDDPTSDGWPGWNSHVRAALVERKFHAFDYWRKLKELMQMMPEVVQLTILSNVDYQQSFRLSPWNLCLHAVSCMKNLQRLCLEVDYIKDSLALLTCLTCLPNLTSLSIPYRCYHQQKLRKQSWDPSWSPSSEFQLENLDYLLIAEDITIEVWFRILPYCPSIKTLILEDVINSISNLKLRNHSLQTVLLPIQSTLRELRIVFGRSTSNPELPKLQDLRISDISNLRILCISNWFFGPETTSDDLVKHLFAGPLVNFELKYSEAFSTNMKIEVSMLQVLGDAVRKAQQLRQVNLTLSLITRGNTSRRGDTALSVMRSFKASLGRKGTRLIFHFDEILY